MNMQTNTLGVAVDKPQTAPIVPQDNGQQGNRNTSLNALEQEIRDLEAQYATPGVSQAGTQQSDTSTNQNLVPNQMIPSDGAATSTDMAPATSGQSTLTDRERQAITKKYYDEEITAERKLTASLKQQLAAAKNPPQSAAELDALKASNPDMFKAFEAMVNNNNNSNTEARVEELMSELAKSRQEKAVGEVVNKHSDFYDIVKSDDWASWKNTQPQGIQDMITGNADNSVAMIRAIDLYKFDKGTKPLQAQTSSNNNQQVMNSSAADAVVGAQSTNVDSTGQSNKKIWTRSEIAKMTIQQYETFEQDILLAQRENRIKDDTSRQY